MMRLMMLLLATLLLAACNGSGDGLGLGDDGGQSDGTATPAGPLVLKALNTLPPGESGFVSATGQVQGLLSGNPGDYGPHIDDQRRLYWRGEYKDGGLREQCANPATPKKGVAICRGDYGVPAIYAETAYNLAWGMGYAVAQDRLFLLDAVRRMGGGTMAELQGCGALADDIKARTLTYTEAEYQAMYAALPKEYQDIISGYVDGANAWIAKVQADPSKLPAEYVLLTSSPQPISKIDVIRAGVLITRQVAAEGGNEFSNIRMLRALQGEFGTLAGRNIFRDLVWQEDAKAVTTIPRSEGVFSNQPLPAQGRTATFNQMADWALALPDSLASGPGTGDVTLPVGCALNTLPIAIPGLGAGKPPQPHSKAKAKQRRAALRRLSTQLTAWRRSLHGGSFMVAVGASRTLHGGTLLISEPQLGYAYPTQLVEVELHGAGYDVRGATVPMLPVVGIGYNRNVAWAATTGYSKTIDSFIETIRRENGVLQYQHDGQWQPMDCRTAVLKYRVSVNGIPAGPAILTQNQQICRTVHGPVVAMDVAAGYARSVSYAMWMHEIDNIEGIAELGKAASFADVQAAAAKLTWNENLGVATRDGHIAFYHPGRYPRRSAQTDQRFPTPGTGEYDFDGYLSFAEMPQMVDPAQGYFANWNNKPAYGWLDGEGIGPTSRPAGHGQRVTTLLNTLAGKDDWTFADLQQLDWHAGTTDHRAHDFIPLLASVAQSAADRLSGTEAAAIQLLLGWDHSHYGPDANRDDTAVTDSPAATIFDYFIKALRDTLFADLKQAVIDPGAGTTAFSRQADVGSHVFEQSVLDNLALRILEPSSSSLTPNHDYLQGRSRDDVLLAALQLALTRLQQRFGGANPLVPADLQHFTRAHPRSQINSLTGVIGPSTTMPYLDRGSWVELIGFEPEETP